MLLTLTNTASPATDLGYLLHKHPDKVQRFSLTFGEAHVFFPEATDLRCTACLLVDVDPVGLVRGKNDKASGLLDQYVNDRPYAASSFLSVALREVFSTALSGRCTGKPELADQPLPLIARLPVVPARGGEAMVRALFEPLGYAVTLSGQPLNPRFPEWGESPYVDLTLSATVTVSQLLSHLYVLLPVLDNGKHYYVGEDELDKLLRHGIDWLPTHPEKALIARRYLRHKWSLAREALARLEVVEEEADEDNAEIVVVDPAAETEPIATASLNDQRLATVTDTLAAEAIESVVDLGCGVGKLLAHLLADRRYRRIVGLDVSVRALEIAASRLKLERLPPAKRERIELLHGALTYRDARIEGFDAAVAIEVIEHLDPDRLAAFERVLFGTARPRLALVTTPNREYNARYEMPDDRLRHTDHRFEWSRAEFAAWTGRIAQTYGYTMEIKPVGELDAELGAPTQMAVFRRNDNQQEAAA
jgi:3' terminal RNA ribose 2'-O-methyltransferase Hen1